MDKNIFGKIMDSPQSVSPAEWEELHRERDSHPFCAPLQVMSLLADKRFATPLWEKQSLPVVSLYVDANRLQEQLEGLSVPPVESQPRPVQPPVPPAARPPFPPEEREDFDILQEINAYQDISFKTAPKSVILSNFLEKDSGMVPDSESFSEVSVLELAKKSVQPLESLESETLAIVLEKQGKLPQAIAMYEKLMADNPEKSSNFAVRIAELKTRLTE